MRRVVATGKTNKEATKRIPTTLQETAMISALKE